MLGKNHVGISFGTILPFIIPFFFLHNQEIIKYGIGFSIAIIIGSLVPDADCGGKSKLYYDFWIVAYIMGPIQKIVIWMFNHSKIKEKISRIAEVTSDVNHEHRGIMHSPVGVFISTLMLTIILSLFLIFLKYFNIIFVLVIFLGLIIGQLLHLLEDSCTISGINWKFPFGEKKVKGKIYTFERLEGKRDIRPSLYSGILITITAIIFFIFALEIIKIKLFYYYPIALSFILIAWLLFIWLSKSEANFWYVDKEKIKEFNKKIRRIGKNFS